MKLIIYGAGGQGRVLLRLAREINALDSRWDEILFADDVIPEPDVMGQRVYPFVEIAENFEPGKVEFVISLGEPEHRRLLFERVGKAGFSFCDPIDPNKENLKYNRLGKGVVVTRNAGLSNNISIGDNTYVSGGVGHDGTVGKHSFISAGVVIGGGCTIGNGTYIGLNAAIRDHIKIGSNVIISIGSCVFQDLPDNVKVMGNPAQIIPGFAGQKVFS